MSFLGLHAVPSPSLPIAATFALHTAHFLTGILGASRAFKIADRDAGKRLTPKSSISSQLLATGIQVANFACTIVPFACYATLPWYGWRVPGWAERFSLPVSRESFFGLGEVREWQWVGVGLFAATYGFYCWSFYILSKQGAFSGLEPRERHRLVDSGPFSIIRHPLYFVALSIPLWTTLSLWNATPLIQFFGYVISLVPKIPVEESLLEDEDVLGAKYTEYKKRVPYRVVPFIW